MKKIRGSFVLGNVLRLIEGFKVPAFVWGAERSCGDKPRGVGVYIASPRILIIEILVWAQHIQQRQEQKW
jgi:hypothetical protein